MKFTKYLLITLFILLVSCSDNNISSLETHGKINGYIYDFEDENVLAKCTVTLFPAVGSQRSNVQGYFNFPKIDVGEYSIKVEKDGFRAYDGKVIVFDDEITTLNISLKKEIVYN